MPTRTSTRQAAVKANEALQQNTRAGPKKTGGKRKGSTEEGAPRTKRGKQVKKEHEDVHAKQKPVPAKQEPSEPPKDQSIGEGDQQNGGDVNGKPKEHGIKEENQSEEKPTREAEPKEEKNGDNAPKETAIRRSEERQESLPSNILEKGLVYFFFRSRVSVQDPESVDDVARTFIVLRPVPLDTELGKGPIGDEDTCRLLVLPKKQLPTTSRERYMGFVEKAGTTLKTIKESFRGTEYDTKTRGHQEVPSATPFAEGVYAITSTARSSHLAYILTIPQELSEVQTDLGLSKKGSFIVSSKSPKFAGPSTARLPKGPEYPQEILDEFRDLRWVPLQPKYIDYPNAQFLMIGEAQGDLGKAGLTEGKEGEEKEAGEELEQLEQEDEARASPLRDDHIVFQDLGMSSKEFSSMPTTWE